MDIVQRDQIQESSVGQFGNETYEQERKFRLTASLFGRVLNRRAYTPCHNIVKSCLHNNNNVWSEAIAFGISKEMVAIQWFEKITSLKVKLSGLWIDLHYGFLGASPDGTKSTAIIISFSLLL